MPKFERYPFLLINSRPDRLALTGLLGLVWLLSGVAGCAGSAVQPPVTQQTSAPPLSVPTVEGDRVQEDRVQEARVDEPATNPPAAQKLPLRQTWLTLHIGKAGKLARLGHNHLITAPLTGQAWLDATGTLHAVATAAVNDLIVDDPERRAAAVNAGNPDYASVPTAKNIRDTRTNMLSPRVLDAAQYPQIKATAAVTAAAAEFKAATSGSLNAQFNLHIRGAQHSLPAVLLWQHSEDQISWTTSFTISHQQLGMTPFSALGGALRVADPIRVELQGVLNGPFSFGSD